MDTLNKKYDLKLTVLSPLHIGAGSEKDWIEGADFIHKNGKVYKLNFKKVAKELGADAMADYLLNRDGDGLSRKLPGQINDFTDHVFSMKYQSTNPIKTFIKEGLSDHPYIPGSSIKGAIRSILFNYLRDQERDDKEVFGSANKGDEFMRFMKLSDVRIKDKTELINTKIFNLFGNDYNAGGWKHKGGKFGKTDSQFKHQGFNTIYEILKTESFGFLTLAISSTAYHKIKSHFKKDKKDKIMDNDIQYLFSIINGHTSRYILKQIEFLKKYPNNETDKIINNLNDLLQNIPKDNSACVFKMAAGSGYHSITGDWQYDDFDNTGTWDRGIHKGKKKAKSRKIAVSGDNFQMMGFVELRILTEQEKSKIQKQEEERKAAQIRAAEVARKEQEKIEEEKRLEEEKIKLEKEAEERVKKEKEERDARKLKEFQEQQEKEKAEMAERQKINLANKEAEKENAVQEGIASKLADIDDYETGETIIREYKRIVETIPESDYQPIHDFLFRSVDLKSLSKKQQKKWDNFKRWNLIRSWVDDKTAKEWFDKLNS